MEQPCITKGTDEIGLENYNAGQKSEVPKESPIHYRDYVNSTPSHPVEVIQSPTYQVFI